jgi:hypothetical protein
MVKVITQAENEKEPQTRGPRYAWKHWNRVKEESIRLELIKSFEEAYRTDPQNAFGSSTRARSSLWVLLTIFQGELGWDTADFRAVFRELRIYLTDVLAHEPFLTILKTHGVRPSTADPSRAREWLFSHGRIPHNKRKSDEASSLNEAANVGFDRFHEWLEKEKPGIYERVKSLLPFSLGDIPKVKLQTTLSWTLASWFKGIVAILLFILSVISGRYLISCDACKSGREKKGTLSNEPKEDVERQNSKQEPTALVAVDAGSVIAVPPECARLPKSPERKSCLIRAADASRQDLPLAQALYDLAIKEPYDPAKAGLHAIEDGYVGGFSWNKEAAGTPLWKAQTFQALAGLSSLFALHGEFENAATTWNRAIRISQSADGFVFGPGPSRYEYHVKSFLDRRAGIQVDAEHCGYQIFRSMCRCHVERGFQLFAAGRWLEALDDLTYGIGDMGAPLFDDRLETPDLATRSRYWASIIPNAGATVKEVHRLTDVVITKLGEEQKAIVVDGIAFWLHSADVVSAAVIEFPWSQDCKAKRPLGSGDEQWTLGLSVNGIEAKGQFPRLEGVPVMATVPPGPTARMAATLQLINATASPLRCGHREAEMRICRIGTEVSLRALSALCN